MNSYLKIRKKQSKESILLGQSMMIQGSRLRYADSKVVMRPRGQSDCTRVNADQVADPGSGSVRYADPLCSKTAPFYDGYKQPFKIKFSLFFSFYFFSVLQKENLSSLSCYGDFRWPSPPYAAAVAALGCRLRWHSGERKALVDRSEPSGSKSVLLLA